MIVKAVQTSVVLPGGPTILAVLDKAVTKLEEGSVVAIVSKIVAICEGRIVPIDAVDKEELIKSQADYYLPPALSKHGISFSITKNTLIPMAGVDESNGNGNYILWPADPQKSANDIRQYLAKRFSLRKVGVIITDSSVMPLRWGTCGIALAYSGFKPVNDYIGKIDLFDRPFSYSKSGVATGLAAAAVLAMGEGTEQTPLAIIADVPFVQFQDHNPTKKELGEFYILDYDDDLFAPFFSGVKWLPDIKKRQEA